MSARRIEITVSEELWGRLNVARGHEPRASFVKRALESALAAGTKAPESGGPDGGQSSPAPSRASVSQAPTGPHVGGTLPEPKRAALKRGSEVVMRFRCPDVRCPRRFGSAAAVCPDHGRRAVEAS